MKTCQDDSVTSTKHDQCVAYQISLDQKTDAMRLDFFGRLTLKELVDSFSSLIRHQDFKANISVCYNFTQALVDINLKETEIYFHFVSGLRSKRGDNYRLAFVHDDHMAELLVNFYRLFLSHSPIEVFSTQHLHEANNWLVH